MISCGRTAVSMNEREVRTVTHWVAGAESLHLHTRPTCSGLRARAASPHGSAARAWQPCNTGMPAVSTLHGALTLGAHA